jgi:hypothetical protein
MTHRRDDEPRIDAAASAKIDALLDAEVPQKDMRRLYDSIRADSNAREELARLRYTVAQLKTPVDAPDLCESILHQANTRRRFLSGRSRRMVTAGRCAAAAGLVAAIGLMSFAQRYTPISQLAGDTQPVTQLVESAAASHGAAQELASGAMHTIQASIASPVSRLALDPRMRPESRYHYDLSIPTMVPGVAVRPSDTPLRVVVSRAPVAIQTAVFEPGPASRMGADSPFIGRFDSVLVVLREPPSVSEDRHTEGDDR